MRPDSRLGYEVGGNDDLNGVICRGFDRGRGGVRERNNARYPCMQRNPKGAEQQKKDKSRDTIHRKVFPGHERQ